MMRLRLLVVMVVGLGVSHPALAQSRSLDLNVNDDAVRLLYAAPIQRGPFDGLGMDVGFLRNTEEGNVGNLGVHVAGDAGMRNLPTEVAVGANLFWADPDNLGDEAETLGLGLGLRFDSVFAQYNRLGFGGRAYFSPRVLTFLDGERYTELGFRINYHIIREAHIYAGYRRIRIGFEDRPSQTMESGFHGGLKLRF